MGPMDDPAEYLKIEDAARFLGVSRRWVYRRIWSGELSASKVGGLYFIHKQDLQGLLAQRRTPVIGDTLDTESGSSPIKCGNCFRLIGTDAQFGAVCLATGCEKIICTQCLAEGVHYCIQHAPQPGEKLEQAVDRLQSGEISLLVKDATARLREVNFINRVQARIARVNTLIHPLSREVLTISNWDAYLEQKDERAEVMRVLGKMVLDSQTLARVPLNVLLRYHLPPSKGQKGPPLEIYIQVLSRMEVMLHDSFDTRPLGADDLIPWLIRFSDETQRSQSFRMIVLASTTGWDQAARQVVQGEESSKSSSKGLPFAHRNVLFYLFDLEKNELTYNLRDDRARGYAELFAPMLPSEEVDEAVQAIERELCVYDSLTLQYAARTMPYPEALLKQAFERLVTTGRYVLTEVPELGTAILKR